MWKLADGVSKPDFRHWLDSVEIQLEAIHGFVYPDFVFEKMKRLPTEVTAASLSQAIAKINVDHKKKLRPARVAAGESEVIAPPGIGANSDPWHSSNVGLTGADLIDPSSWDFSDKSRWM